MSKMGYREGSGLGKDEQVRGWGEVSILQNFSATVVLGRGDEKRWIENKGSFLKWRV